MKKQYLECGKLVNTHGVRGTFKLEVWCDSPKVAASLRRIFFEEKDGSYKEMKVKSASVAAGVVLISLDGIDDLDSARLFKGRVAFAHRDDIPLGEGEHFIADLLGLPVYDADTKRLYGTLKDADMERKTPLYTIQTEKGDVLFPAIPEFVKEVDTDTGIFVCPIPGFFDEV